jgi:hypothetical protein
MIDITALKRQFLLKMNSESDRYQMLDFLERWLKGILYDDLIYEFYFPEDSMPTYIPLRERKPSVMYNLAKIMVDRSTDMLFGDNHWPTLTSADKNTETAVRAIVEESGCQRYWRKAARMGAVGTVAVIFKILDGKVYHEVLNAKYCTPVFNPKNPTDVIKITEQKRVMGVELQACGYPDADPDDKYFYRRVFTETEEIEYFPIKVSEVSGELNGLRWKKNDDRSFEHNLGFLPGVWIKNLESEDKLDGTATFDQLLTFQTEIDYQLSQTGRVFHYTGDPLTVFIDPSLAEEDGEARIRSAGNTVILNEGGEAYNLEVQATAQSVVLEYIEQLRKYALEVGRGNRADADKISAASSGKALELLHKDLIGLTDELRVQYGNYGLLVYLKKLLKATKKYKMDYPEVTKELKAMNADATLKLEWGAHFEPTSTDDRETSLFLTESVTNGSISEETATKIIAPRARVTDIAAERAQISKERDEADKRAIKLDQTQQAAQTRKSASIQKKSSAPPEKS